MKILLFGHISFNLMSPFYLELKKKLPDSLISVCGLNRPGSDLSFEQYSVFDDVVKKPSLNDASFYKSFFSFYWIKHLSFFIVMHIIKLCLTLKIRNCWRDIQRFINQAWLDENTLKILNKYDIINIHYLSKDNLRVIAKVDKGVKVILSFWGSDLFSTDGCETFRIQSEAIERAEIITIHTDELRTILLSKYGWKLKTKVYTSIFGCHDNRLNLIDQLKKDKVELSKIKRKYNLPDECILIQIGYSGSATHNHIDAIAALNKLEMKSLDKEVVLIVPTTYNTDSKYSQLLDKTLAESKHRAVRINKYMTDIEVLALALLCDVFINVRDMDALNNSMMEALYAGSIVIVGAWLPYRILKRNGVIYWEVDRISEIATTIEKAYSSSDDIKKEVSGNKVVVRSQFTLNKNINKWIKYFEKN